MKFKKLRGTMLVPWPRPHNIFLKTPKVWNTTTGDELLTLDGHRNVVYAIAFNNPWGDKIITGSFDKTCKLWNAEVLAARPDLMAIKRSTFGVGRCDNGYVGDDRFA